MYRKNVSRLRHSVQLKLCHLGEKNSFSSLKLKIIAISLAQIFSSAIFKIALV